MKLLTAAIRRSLPPIYAVDEGKAQPILRVKFFTPWTNWTWYAMEFDGEDRFFGLVDGHEVELGYFSLKELEEIEGPAGLRIERDRHFEPIGLDVLRDRLLASRRTAEDHPRGRER